jgi:hypothetical protein
MVMHWVDSNGRFSSLSVWENSTGMLHRLSNAANHVLWLVVSQFQFTVDSVHSSFLQGRGQIEKL